MRYEPHLSERVATFYSLTVRRKLRISIRYHRADDITNRLSLGCRPGRCSRARFRETAFFPQEKRRKLFPLLLCLVVGCPAAARDSHTVVLPR